MARKGLENLIVRNGVKVISDCANQGQSAVWLEFLGLPFDWRWFIPFFLLSGMGGALEAILISR